MTDSPPTEKKDPNDTSSQKPDVTRDNTLTETSPEPSATPTESTSSESPSSSDASPASEAYPTADGSPSSTVTASSSGSANADVALSSAVTPTQDKTRTSDTSSESAGSPSSAAPPPGGGKSRERKPDRAHAAGAPKLAIAISVITLLIVLGVGYWLWQALQSVANDQTDRVQTWESDLQQQESRIQALQDTVEQVSRAGDTLQQDIREELTETQAEVQQLLADFDQRQQQHLERLDDRLDAQQQRLVRLSTSDREDWLLSEAMHLLRFANQRILIERSPANAIALLESADELLQQAMGGSGDAELFAIRKSIRSEITALKLVKSPDKTGNYARLAGLVEHLDELPARGGLPLGQPFPESSAESETEEASGWREKLWGEIKSLAGVFDDYVRVQDADTPTELLTDQAALQLVRMNLHLLVDQAQAALIREEETLYRDSLEKIREFLLQYYEPSSERDALEQMLDELSQVPVSPRMPDVSGSFKRLQAYVEEMHRLREGDDQ